MKKKFERVFRQGRLSADEVARDEAIRRQVCAEFPPAAPSDTRAGGLSQALREALRASDKPIEQLAQDAGVAPIVLTRFLCGERDIHMATADKLALALGVTLAKVP
jgi:hypothetical protein